MNVQSKRLFGGALICAGLAMGGAASTANANGAYGYGFQFAPAPGGTVQFDGYSYNGNGYNSTYTYAYGGPAGLHSYAGIFGPTGFDLVYGSSFTGNTYASVFAYSYANTYSGVGGFSQIQMDIYAQYAQVLNVYWDFGVLNTGLDLVWLDGADITGGAISGYTTISLSAGQTALITISVDSATNQQFAIGTANAHITPKAYKLPAPGAIALLGAAGLIGKRRRRE